jgi:hypothetical protein
MLPTPFNYDLRLVRPLESFLLVGSLVVAVDAYDGFLDGAQKCDDAKKGSEVGEARIVPPLMDWLGDNFDFLR